MYFHFWAHCQLKLKSTKLKGYILNPKMQKSESAKTNIIYSITTVWPIFWNDLNHKLYPFLCFRPTHFYSYNLFCALICLRWCVFIFPFSANLFPQISHAYGFSPVWTLSCLIKLEPDGKHFSQNRHWYLYGPFLCWATCWASESRMKNYKNDDLVYTVKPVLRSSLCKNPWGQNTTIWV